MISTYEFLATWLRARFADTERGASLVEYALLVALIAVICIVALPFLGKRPPSPSSSTGDAIGGAKLVEPTRQQEGRATRPAPPSASSVRGLSRCRQVAAEGGAPAADSTQCRPGTAARQLAIRDEDLGARCAVSRTTRSMS